MKLPQLTREEAARQGYASITTVFSPSDEPDLVPSMERSMKGIDAVWITQTNGYRHVVELGRKANEINLLLSDGHGKLEWRAA